MFGCHSAARRTRRASPPSSIPVPSFLILCAQRLPRSDRSISAFNSSPCLCRCRASARPLSPASCSGGSLDPRLYFPVIFFRIRTSKKPNRNPSRIRTSKTKHLKLFGMNTYRKKGTGAPSASLLTQSAPVISLRGSAHSASLRYLFPLFVSRPRLNQGESLEP